MSQTRRSVFRLPKHKLGGNDPQKRLRSHVGPWYTPFISLFLRNSTGDTQAVPAVYFACRVALINGCVWRADRQRRFGI